MMCIKLMYRMIIKHKTKIQTSNKKVGSKKKIMIITNKIKTKIKMKANNNNKRIRKKENSNNSSELKTTLMINY